MRHSVKRCSASVGEVLVFVAEANRLEAIGTIRGVVEGGRSGGGRFVAPVFLYPGPERIESEMCHR